MNFAPQARRRAVPRRPPERIPEGELPPPTRRRLASPLTRRILLVNLLAPVILVAGLLYLDRYKNELLANDLASLRLRAEMVAAAVGEGGVIDNGVDRPLLSPHLARLMIGRLSEPAHLRSRLFTAEGQLVADSRVLISPQTIVQVEELPPPQSGGWLRALRHAYQFVATFGAGIGDLPRDADRIRSRASDYPEVILALTGEAGSGVRRTADNRILLSAAVPVQQFKQVMGALLATEIDDDLEQSLFNVRLTIIEAFAIACVITITLSFYLAGTIARPIRRLAAAAERVRHSYGGRYTIPDLTPRGDEIGDLSVALREMTETLWRRMDATEAFAADVAHEIKNPLTSLRSAVETAALVTDPDRQRKLLSIIQDDVVRLDRLISDISDASRLEAEMSRADTGRVDMRAMLAAMADAYQFAAAKAGVTVRVEPGDGGRLEVNGVEGRLGQVLRNLIENALSFSPEGGRIALRGRREGAEVVIEVEDDGPGIPDNKLYAIFDRFYSERPKAEKFGIHSGLGLSISKQIVEAHRGSIAAANRRDESGATAGARFTIRLSAAAAKPLAPPRR